MSAVIISPEAWVELNELGSEEERELKCQVQFGMSYEEATAKYADDWLESNIKSGKIMFKSYVFENCWNDVVLKVTFLSNNISFDDKTTPQAILKQLPIHDYSDVTWTTSNVHSQLIGGSNGKQGATITTTPGWATAIGSSYDYANTKTEFTLTFVLACIGEQTIKTLKMALANTYNNPALTEIVNGFEAQIQAFKRF